MFYLFRVWLPLSFVSLKIDFIKSIVSILVEMNCFAINQLISCCKTPCLSQISVANLGQIGISLINKACHTGIIIKFFCSFGENNSNDCFIQS